ncbi:MAG: calcium/proton exchanger [Chloroflexi bacterium RBG_16_57_11]|nr:MAG: calcium/proton exchanger [Chloroflexi bacterium RBG_16_57_11]
MKIVGKFFREQPVNLLLLALPLAILAEIGGRGEMWGFALSSLAIIPLAGLIGMSTEALTVYTGPRLGGLLNATLGNAAELIITIVAIREGLLELVKASITGSILGNILLVMGMSMLMGGLRNGIQRFDARHASRSAILLMLSVIALLVPSVLSSSIGPTDSVQVETLSLGVAVIMIILYASALFFSFRDTNGLVAEAITTETPKVRHLEHGVEVSAEPTSHWSLRTSLIMLVLSTSGVVVMSEILVGVVEPVVASLGVSEFFLGIILIPLIGNVAEHLVAVKMAIQNQMDLSVEIAVASSLQIALFVAPALVFISLVIGNPLQLIFNEFELLALIVGVLSTVMISMDGESNWLEGAELLAVYLILALAFFLLPV